MFVDVEQVEHLGDRLDAHAPPIANGRETRRSSELKLSLNRALSDTSGSGTPLTPPLAFSARDEGVQLAPRS